MTKRHPTLLVDGLSKKFCRDLKRSLWYGVKDLASELFLSSGHDRDLRKEEFWALEDISFEVRPGQTLGVIGHNGAGKSTLLKLVNGLIKPDRGLIETRGEVGALIALGTGFNPVLTGRENVVVNAAVLGLSKKEIDAQLQAIIDFAEIDEFIDAPVRSYSSGMVVRLGFSVASTLNRDLLLIDEVLSVGDASFRHKCYERLTKYKKNGGAALFVSHNTAAVEAISDQVMLLDRGELVQIGEPSAVAVKYEQAMALRRRDQSPGGKTGGDSEREILFNKVNCYDLEGEERLEFDYGSSFVVRLEYEVVGTLTSPRFVLALKRQGRDGAPDAYISMAWDQFDIGPLSGMGVVKCVIEKPNLPPGNYVVEAAVQALQVAAMGSKYLVEQRPYATITILPGSLADRLPGVPAASIVSMPNFVLQHRWEVD